MQHREKTPEQLREFGEVMTLACLVFAGIGIWKRSHVTGVAAALLILGACFLILGLFAPHLLRGVERNWMKFAEKLGTVVTYLVMALTFFVVITPLGLLLRLFGKDLLGLKLSPERASYWEPVEKDGPGTRYYTPY